jgi:hypothetical protein
VGEHRAGDAVADGIDAGDAGLPAVVGPDLAALGLLAEGVDPAAAIALVRPPVDRPDAVGESHRRLARRNALLPAKRPAEVRDLHFAGADPQIHGPRRSGRTSRGRRRCWCRRARTTFLPINVRMIVGRLRAEGAAVTLELVPGVPHVWQFWHGYLPEADAAMGRAAAFLVRALPRRV